MQVTNQQQELITKEDVKLWHEDKVTKKFLDNMKTLKNDMTQCILNEDVLLKGSALHLSNYYGVLKAIVILENSELEDQITEETENDDRHYEI